MKSSNSNRIRYNKVRHPNLVGSVDRVVLADALDEQFGNFLSDTVGTLPDSTGAVVGTNGAYFKDANTWQLLEWDGSEWQEIGESIATKGFVDDKASLSPYIWLNVTRFGAKGDNLEASAESNQIAVKAAIEFAESQGGGIVFFPAGIYRFSYPVGEASVTLKDNITLVGEGKGVTVLMASDNAPVPGDPNTDEADKPFLVEGDNVNNVSIRSMTLDGNNQRYDNPTTHGWFEVAEIDGNGVELIDVDLINGIAEGLDVDTGSNYRLVNVNAINCGGNGLHLSGGALNNVMLLNCFVDNCAHVRGEVGGTPADRSAGILVDASRFHASNVRVSNSYRGILIGGGGGFQDNVYLNNPVILNSSNESIRIVGNPSRVRIYNPENRQSLFLGDCDDVKVWGGRSSTIVYTAGATNLDIHGHDYNFVASLGDVGVQEFKPFLLGGRVREIAGQQLAIDQDEIIKYTPFKKRSLLIVSANNSDRSGMAHIRAESTNFVRVIDAGDDCNIVTHTGEPTIEDGENNKLNFFVSTDGSVYISNRTPGVTGFSVTIL